MFGIDIQYILIPLTAAIVGGMLAGRKGRNVAGWAIGCFILPVLLLVVALLGPAGPVHGKYRTCPHCAELTKWQANTCPHCQKDIPAPQ